MLIQHFFSAMMEQLDKITDEYPVADSNKKQELDYQLYELRHLSDSILDFWLEFEEKMAQVSQAVAVPNQVKEYGLNDLSDQNNFEEYYTKDGKQTLHVISDEISHHFRKGQGYFDLNMYEQSIPHFDLVVNQNPELNVARLYLALGYFHSSQMDKATIHLQLLIQTEDHPILKALSHNTMGCIFAEQGEEESALKHFAEALDYFPQFSDAAFNKSYLLIKQKHYVEAIHILHTLIDEEQPDWEVVMLLSEAYRKTGDIQKADLLNQQLLQMTNEPELLVKMASENEKRGKYHNASICYLKIVNHYPDKAWAWHGLAWNMWLHQPSRNCILQMKKAISLDPKNLDYWFSYGWILHQTGNVEKSEEVFEKLLTSNSAHVLSLSALIISHGQKGNVSKAENLCQRLISQKDPYIRGLGYHHMGRLSLIKGDYWGAIPYFNQSIQLTGEELKENYLYQGLCLFFEGREAEAADQWEQIFSNLQV